MEPPRFYCPQIVRGVVTLDESQSRHALQSLRLGPGDSVVLFDGRGQVVRGTLRPDEPTSRESRPRRAGKRTRVAAITVRKVVSEPLPNRTLTLIVAGCKGARLDWLVETCTELGVSRLVLTEFDRSVVHTGPRHVGKLRRTAIEACKQCRRAVRPPRRAYSAGGNGRHCRCGELGGRRVGRQVIPP